MELYPKKSRRGGKKNRKHGRMARKPAHQRYNNEKRWEKNKERRIEKEKKRQERLKVKKMCLCPKMKGTTHRTISDIKGIK